MYARPIRRALLRSHRSFIPATSERSTTSYLLSLSRPLSLLSSPSRRLLPVATTTTTTTTTAVKAHKFHTTSTTRVKSVQKFNLADIGEGITECEIIKWSVTEGQRVSAFDPLCEVQSDKASVEITSPFDGVVTKLIVSEGTIAKVGEGLCLIETEDVNVPHGSQTSSSSTTSDLPPAALEQQRETTATTTTIEEPRRLHPLDPNYTPPSVPGGSVGQALDVDVLAAPSVRHFARQNDVNLVLLMPGTGKGGRIEKADVERYLERGRAAPEAGAEVGSLRTVSDQDVVVELGRTRYGMWKAMTKSLEIPHFGYTTSLDLTELEKLLPVLNEHIPDRFVGQDYDEDSIYRRAVNPSAIYPAPSQAPVPRSYRFSRLTYLPFLLKTLSKAMIEWPLFRSSITPVQDWPTGQQQQQQPSPKPTLTVRPHADISIALSTPTGLYTPTLTSVDKASVYDIASSVSHLANMGRQVPSGLTTKEMPKRGGTITVSNVGAIGRAESAMPVLVPGGGVAIVALGRARWVLDVKGEDEDGDEDVMGGGGERRLKMSVSWSGDHRVVEGAELAAFVECWRGYVENPGRLVAEGV